jgi:hypothetical protein
MPWNLGNALETWECLGNLEMPWKLDLKNRQWIPEHSHLRKQSPESKHIPL